MKQISRPGLTKSVDKSHQKNILQALVAALIVTAAIFCGPPAPAEPAHEEYRGAVKTPSDKKAIESGNNSDAEKGKEILAYGVCPFTNTAGDRKYDWIADGIAESISSDLKLASHTVVDRINVKDIINEVGLGQTGLMDQKSAAKSGKMLGAAYLVTGSYQIFNNTIRIVSKVIQTETGVVNRMAKVTGPISAIFDLQDGLFSQMFSLKQDGMKLEDIPIIQNEIKKKPTINLDAYKYYLLCEEYNYRGANIDDPGTRKYLEKSVEYGLKAIRLDPSMTIAYLKVSHTYAGLNDDNNCNMMITRAVKSLSDETNIIVKNLVHGNYEIRVNRDFKKAIFHYETVLRYNKSDIEALWQLWAIFRGAFGSTVYDRSMSDGYRDAFLKYHPRSILAKHVRELSVYDRLR